MTGTVAGAAFAGAILVDSLAIVALRETTMLTLTTPTKIA
jgi:hypothetical protein